MNLFQSIIGLKRKIPFTLDNLKGVARLVNDPNLSKSYFPEQPRKEKLSIWKDNLLWLAKHGEVNRYYYVYGLDRKTGPNGTEVLPYKEFRRIRDSKNQRPNKDGYNYVCILRDKFIFSQFLSSIGFPTTKNIAFLNKDQVTWLKDMRTESLATISSDAGLFVNGFCKKLAGILGEGAFPLTIKDGKFFIKEQQVSLDELQERLNGQYLLQEKLLQHPVMNELHPNSINTIRLITFNNNGKVEFFCAALRIGTKGRSVDNWASGGIVVGIEPETGRLRQEGIFKPGYGGRVEKHPDTGVVLKDFQVPFFRESIDLAQRLHGYLYGIHSIGWDIAITPDGPVFIEGNDDWEGGIPMSLEKDFKSRFLKMFENNSPKKMVL